MASKKRTLLKSREIHKAKMFTVAEHEMRLPNGLEVTRTLVHHPGAVCVLPVLNDGRLIFIKQFRHAIDAELLEIPAGTMEPKEDPRVCAERELEEETGYAASRWESLGEFYPAPGFCDEVQYFFIAKDLKKTATSFDEDEIIELALVHPSEIPSLIKSGALKDNKTIAMIVIAQAHGLL